MPSDNIASAETAATDSFVTALHTKAAERFEVVPLEWPVSYGGRHYDSITVRRMSVAEIDDFLADLKRRGAAGENTDNLRFPMFDAPQEVLRALDVDDDDRLNEAANRFLPRRYQAVRGSTPARTDGADSPPA